MYYYRISKYNPKYRNSSGDYVLEDWTSYSDIGETFFNKELTLEKYRIVENLFIDVVIFAMKETQQDFLIVSELEKIVDKNSILNVGSESYTFYKNVHNNARISLKEIPLFMKLQLREYLWGKLVSENLSIHFGYDYYMYMISSKRLNKLIDLFYKKGIYIEENFRSPYE
ncbi:hypothetical protein D920_00295 [Enterococcus faecalis 13-SD-W-01]|nr:hypothetical protein D920_00295 [Enterococcus faecalis 13-SD-W-01]